MSEEKTLFGALDYFRIAAALLVIAIHTAPLEAVSETADFFLTRILARLAVPFFFMVTGYFILGRDGTPSRLRRFLVRTFLFYLGAILLYLPFGIYAGHYEHITFGSVLRMFLFDGSFYHLWYFPACILGILLAAAMKRFLSIKAVAAAAGILYLLGLMGDSYYGLTAKAAPLASLCGVGFNLWSYTRNGLFFAPVFLFAGAWISENEKEPCPTGFCAYSRIGSLAGFLLSFLFMSTEAFLLRHFKVPRHDSMYLFLVPSAYFLFRFLLSMECKPNARLRTVSTWIYLLHPALIIILRMAAKPLHLTWLLVDNPLIQFVCVSAMAAGTAFAIAAFKQQSIRWKTAESPQVNLRKNSVSFEPGKRAWIELDRAAFRHNVAYLKSLLPENCRLMPAVKANAYGHGARLIAQELNLLGVDAFCVACAAEGVRLRKCKVTGEILILGYTHPSQFPLLHRYHLTQTVIDASYGARLNEFGEKLHVHVGIDTGMHRLGERSENLEHLQSIFQMENLVVDGVFTHLCTSDGQTEEEEAYAKLQASQFYCTVEALENLGCVCPKIHLLSSYGLLRHPELAQDYVRAGIAIYGVLSGNEDTKRWGTSLKPVLSLKTRIAAVKELLPGESAGYGICYTAQEKRTLAILAIGYADGLPRSFSCGKGFVLIRGKKAPIIGRICMDQTIVDVTEIPDVAAGESAVLIGSQGECQITACDWAQAAGTITNEILSRLGGRLERMWKEE